VIAATLDAAGQAVSASVPGGVWIAGEQEPPVREFRLRPVGGEDELFLLDTMDTRPPSERATSLLSRCLLDGQDHVGRLTVGDREALLLQLRRLTYGEELNCIVSCPAERCGERMDVVLQVSDLLLASYDEARRTYELSLDSAGMSYGVTFRLPTAGDLTRISGLGSDALERGASDLLKHCVLVVTKDGGTGTVDDLPEDVRPAVAARMAELDPQAEIELDLECPACGFAFSVVFDAGAFFLRELDERASRLPAEIHTLAWHYHWSEQDILQMPAARRTRYLELIAATLQRRGAA
jgi:hypothetical protein